MTAMKVSRQEDGKYAQGVYRIKAIALALSLVLVVVISAIRYFIERQPLKDVLIGSAFGLGIAAIVTEVATRIGRLERKQWESEIEQRKQAEQTEFEQRLLAEALRDIAASLSSTLDLDEVLKRVLSRVWRFVPHDAADIILINEVTGNAHLARCQGYEDWATPDEIRAHLQAEMAIFHLFQITAKGALLEHWDLSPATAWIKSTVVTPITSVDQPIGFLALHSAKPNFFTNDHAERLTTLANQAASAIQNAQLHEQLGRHAARLKALHNVTLNITAELDVDILLQTLAENALKLLDAPAGGIYLYRPDQDAIEWQVVVGPWVAPAGSMLKRGEGLSGKVWESGQPLIVNDYKRWEDRSPQYEGYDWGAVLAVPIFWGEEFLGVINATAQGSRTYTAEDIDLLNLFATQAAIAIHNARVFRESQNHNRRLTILNRITRVGTATLDMDELLQTIVNTASSIINADDCAIFLWDEEPPSSAPGTEDSRVRQMAFQSSKPGPAGISLTIAALKAGDTLIVEDMSNTPYVSQESRKNCPVQSAIALPLQTSDRKLGMLGLVFNQPHTFTVDEVAIAEQAAELIALAIIKAQVYAELEHRVEARTVELTLANERLEKASRLKDEFIANTSHELRTPITNLKLYHTLVESNPDKITHYMSTLRRETWRLEHLVEDLLTMSRLDHAQIDLHPQVIDLNKLLSAHVADRQILAQKRALSLEVETSNDLSLVMADREHLEQVLSILLINALTYTPEGGTVTVRVRPTSSNNGVAWGGFSVLDTGPGIPHNELPRIFERFFRGKAAVEAATSGTGLGLSIAQEIVRQHHGQIMAENRTPPETGAQFTVLLPAKVEQPVPLGD
jgi:signal transduction histidine kinase